MTKGKLLNFSMLQFPYLHNDVNKCKHLMGLLRGLNRLINGKGLKLEWALDFLPLLVTMYKLNFSDFISQVLHSSFHIV